MIISRTPFRVSFAGGGSDLPSFYRKSTGAVLSTSIDKYMYIAIHPYFEKDKIQLKYSKTEQVDSIDAIKHPIFKEVLKMYGLTGVDLNSIADIPSGTGLGSSSSFTVGLLNAVRAYLGKATSGEKLGELACDVEINKVGSPIGKQDQYGYNSFAKALVDGNLDEPNRNADGEGCVHRFGVGEAPRNVFRIIQFLLFRKAIAHIERHEDCIAPPLQPVCQAVAVHVEERAFDVVYGEATRYAGGETGRLAVDSLFCSCHEFPNFRVYVSAYARSVLNV